jgi:peptidoglycan-associated lipoprotein
MKLYSKYLSLIAAGALLAACETAPVDDGTAGGAGTGTGTDGSVGGVTPGTQGDLAANVGDRVFFAYDSSVLSTEAQQTLERQAAWLQQYPNVKVTVEGHADERGTREYNIALGERRANAAKSYLVSLGVGADRVTTISYGKERPEVLGSDESAWAQNRRAVTVVVNQ